jgi:hypothetical protein
MAHLIISAGIQNKTIVRNGTFNYLSITEMKNNNTKDRFPR